MTVLTVILSIVAIWIAISVVVALAFGRAVRLADDRHKAQMAMRPRRLPQVARAR